MKRDAERPSRRCEKDTLRIARDKRPTDRFLVSMRRRSDDGRVKLTQKPGRFFAELRSIRRDTLSQLVQLRKQAFESSRITRSKEANRR